MATTKRSQQALLISTDLTDAWAVQIVHKDLVCQQVENLEANGIVKVNRYHTAILLGKFLDHRLTNVVRQDKIAGPFFPKFSPGMAFKDLVEYYHEQDGNRLECLVNAIVNAHRTGTLQQASKASIAIEKARLNGAAKVSTISINPPFQGLPTWLLIDQMVDQLIDNHGLLTKEVNEIVRGLIPLYPDLPFVLDMQHFDEQREHLVGLIPEGNYSAVAIPFYLGAFMEFMPMITVESFGMVRKQLSGEFFSKSPQTGRRPYRCTFIHELPVNTRKAFVLAGMTSLDVNGVMCQFFHYLKTLLLEAILVARMSSYQYHSLQSGKNQILRVNILTIEVYAMSHESLDRLKANFGMVPGRQSVSVNSSKSVPSLLKLMELSPRRYVQIGPIATSHNFHKFPTSLATVNGFLLTNIHAENFYILWTMHRHPPWLAWLETHQVATCMVAPQYDQVTKKSVPHLVSFLFITHTALTSLPEPPIDFHQFAGLIDNNPTRVRVRWYVLDDSLFPQRLSPIHLTLTDKDAKLASAAPRLQQTDINKALNSLTLGDRTGSSTHSRSSTDSNSQQSTTNHTTSYAESVNRMNVSNSNTSIYSGLANDSDDSDHETHTMDSHSQLRQRNLDSNTSRASSGPLTHLTIPSLPVPSDTQSVQSSTDTNTEVTSLTHEVANNFNVLPVTNNLHQFTTDSVDLNRNSKVVWRKRSVDTKMNTIASQLTVVNAENPLERYPQSPIYHIQPNVNANEPATVTISHSVTLPSTTVTTHPSAVRPLLSLTELTHHLSQHSPASIAEINLLLTQLTPTQSTQLITQHPLAPPSSPPLPALLTNSATNVGSSEPPRQLSDPSVPSASASQLTLQLVTSSATQHRAARTPTRIIKKIKLHKYKKASPSVSSRTVTEQADPDTTSHTSSATGVSHYLSLTQRQANSKVPVETVKSKNDVPKRQKDDIVIKEESPLSSSTVHQK